MPAEQKHCHRGITQRSFQMTVSLLYLVECSVDKWWRNHLCQAWTVRGKNQVRDLKTQSNQTTNVTILKRKLLQLASD